jgi:membrane fusion protein (multidrug efflux system)
VENINPIIPGSRTMTVEVRLANEGGLLLPGMFARARVTVHEADNAIYVPNDAVEKTATGSRVFLVTKDGKAEARDVEVSYVSSQFSLIANGLQAGELVITQRPQDLKAGVAVKIIEKT